MRFRSWLNGLNLESPRRRTQCNRSPSSHRKPAGARLLVESLGSRTLPAFLNPVNYVAGPGPQAVVAADFNGDGRLDLATANSDSTVSVLLGNADGTFQTALNSATGANPISIAVGDFDGDGKLDVATANNSDVSVLLGNGDGTFAAPNNTDFSGLGSNPASVAVGDFDGDGRLDLGVTSNAWIIQGFDYYGYPIYGNEGYANVLIGNGDGSFAGPNITDVGAGYHTSAAAANFNGDAYSDFATVNADYSTVSVALGNPGGYLQWTDELYTGGNYPYGVSTGDINGDGMTDLAAASYYNNVGVLLGNGNGTFQPVQNYLSGDNPTAVVIGDFTGDRNTDLAAANDSSANTVSVIQARGDGTFLPPASFLAGSYPYALATGDFNGDGWLDVATANVGGADVSVLINDRHWPPADAPSISMNDVTITEGNTGATSATFTVSLSAAYAQDVTVHYETADLSATAGSDYVAASGDVTIPAGQTTRAVTIAVLGDRLAEPTENFAVNLSGATNAFIADHQGIGVILDDEPRITINDVSGTEGNTGSANATFTVTLSRVYDAPVTFHFATTDISATAGSDYTAASGDVTIPAGQMSTTFPIAVLGDRLPEPTETFAVNLSDPTSAMITDSRGTATIVDNEPRITINNVAKKEGNTGTTQFIFTVSLSAAYDQAVTVNYATANGSATAGSDYQAKQGTLTFAPGVRSMTITINVIGDKVREADETFFVNLSAPSSNSLISDAQGIGTILDDDTHGK